MSLACPYCSLRNDRPPGIRKPARLGSYWRKSDGRSVQRYACRGCGRSFSDATLDPCFSQKKRHFNEAVNLQLCSGVSQRRTALTLKLDRKTVARKLPFLAFLAERRLEEINRSRPAAAEVEFDDLETVEHTKLKPVAVGMMVEAKSRRILGFAVARMPAKGKIAALSLAKYGKRDDERPKKRRALFEKLEPFVSKSALIKSDKLSHYAKDIETGFPGRTHRKFKARKACVAGQGELKGRGFDPIFSINHTFAMLRANINRLFRRTWCTTKRPDRLEAHVMIYAAFHNDVLLANKPKKASAALAPCPELAN